MKFINRQCYSVRKTIIGDCGLSVIILPMDLLTDKANKKKYPLHSVGIFIVEYNISPTENLISFRQ
jgi:hypothetical protein